jgi:small-conductance mechanosensitive channel
MQGQSHAWQNVGEPLNSPDADSQEAIRAPNGRKRTVGRFEEWSYYIETLKDQLSRVEGRAERQAAEFAERAAQVAAEQTARIKALEGRIETLKAQLSAAETQLGQRATEHHANIAAERVKTEAEQAKAARAIARNRELAAELEEERDRTWWKRIWRSGRAEISESRPAERAQWQLPSTTFDRAYRPGDKGALGPLGRHP